MVGIESPLSPVVLQTLPSTKRIMLSDISRLWDPLNLLNSCIITAKIFLQELWPSKNSARLCHLFQDQRNKHVNEASFQSSEGIFTPLLS